MVLTYIYNSCYVLENCHAMVIIDYYCDTTGTVKSGLVNDVMMQKQKEKYFICTHSHSAHFSPAIFSMPGENECMKYVLSDDITISNSMKKNIVFLKKGDTYEDGNIKIKGFGSTDRGISVWIQFDNLNIFHAGDLNNWHWNEEVSVREALRCEQDYLNELEDISKEVRALDVLMFPLDGRLGKDFKKGVTQFIDLIKVKYYAPMHFNGKFDIIKREAQYFHHKNIQYIDWANYGDYISISH